MPTAPNPKKSVKKLYDEGMAEVYRVILDLNSTRTQVRIAKKTAKDLSSMLVSHTLESIEGRTALLAGLIVELNEVTNSVRTNPPYADALTKFTSVLNRAKTLFGEEKKNLT